QMAEADLVDALRASGEAVISLVAEDGDGIVGHILFSKLQAPAGYLALAPPAVAPRRQGQGIGAKLVGEGLARAKSGGWRAAFVVGAPAYYGRFGFAAAAAEPFETIYPKAFVLALELAPGGLACQSGPLLFAPPFLALG
ncbi:MAG: GNAT family N-acetyltransferase, partial [Kiloniellaceae bacterium]